MATFGIFHHILVKIEQFLVVNIFKTHFLIAMISLAYKYEENVPKKEIENRKNAEMMLKLMHTPVLAKLTSFATFGSISPIMTVYNALFDTFSGSTNLWGLLGDSGPSNVTLWWIMGLFRGLQVQIWAKLTSFATI